MPNLRQRKWLLIAIAIAVVVVLTLIAAPNSGGTRIDSGSTYGRKPDGYGAWYEYMSQKEVPIERWHKPFSRLLEENVRDATLIQIYGQTNPFNLSASKQKWVSQGNTLIIIGVFQPATAAPFASSISYRLKPLSEDLIEIETSRRYRQPKGIAETILGDRYGAVVWSEKVGRGKVIYCTTPYLAANAYQNSPDNYKFLAELASQNEAIWVDEYIHGYRNKAKGKSNGNNSSSDARPEQPENVLTYLANTPWLLLFVQTIIIAGVASVSALRRFGKPTVVKNAIADNSTAYIDALAGVLEKANSIDFVVDTIGKDERRKLQASLGLGKSLVDESTLIAAWKQQKQPVTELSQVLQIESNNQKISDARLITWIQKWQRINSQS